MDSILSTVLSVFSHNPIIVLGIIAYVAFLCHLAYRSSESHLPKSMLFDGRCNRLFFYFQKVYKKVLRYAKIF